ncbi:MAG: hypothetical protein WC380_02255 [Pedobacter sp.]
MKRSLFIMGVLLTISFTTLAQGRMQMGTPEERATRQLAQLESLKLSNEQKTKLAAVFLWSARQMDSIRTSLPANGDFQAMRAKMAPVQEDANKMINIILNDEQKKAYELIQEERRKRMSEMMNRN